MGLKIFWTEFSKNQLENIFEYYREIAGSRTAKNLINDILEETLNLKSFPKIGHVEELLIDRKEGFRYIVCKNYKIIYWINDEKNQVEIVDVFDTRQNPTKIERNK